MRVEGVCDYAWVCEPALREKEISCLPESIKGGYRDIFFLFDITSSTSILKYNMAPIFTFSADQWKIPCPARIGNIKINNNNTLEDDNKQNNNNTNDCNNTK